MPFECRLDAPTALCKLADVHEHPGSGVCCYFGMLCLCTLGLIQDIMIDIAA